MKKLKQASIDKITARYEAKKIEFEAKSLEELKEIFNNQKMSRTDRMALVHVADFKLKQLTVENAKLVESTNTEQPNGNSETTNQEEVQSGVSDN